MASSSRRRNAPKVSLEETIIATPMPQASSTVDKHKVNEGHVKEEMPSSAPKEKALRMEELAAHRRKAALAELERKLECMPSFWSEEQPLSTNKDSSIFDESTPRMNQPSFLKMDTLLEESGFTNLHNVSDLEYEEKKRIKNSSYMLSSQIDLSFSVQNSQIDPPDFMPTEDSLFGHLQPHFSKKDEDSAAMKTKQVVGELAQDLSSLKHETFHSSRYTPTIEELSSALKNCLEDTDPRKIMEQLLNAGKKKAPIKSEVLDPVKHHSSLNPSISNIPIDFEEYLVWGNVEIGQSSQKSFHIIHNQDIQEKYKFSIQGNNAFKIIVNWPILSSPTTHAFVIVDRKSSYELSILFQPKIVGEASGYLIIESESRNTSKKVRLNAFGGKGKCILHDITYDPLYNIPYLTLDGSLEMKFKLENSGSAPLFFYFCAGIMEERFEVKPKLGFIQPNTYVDAHVNMNIKQIFRLESICSSQETFVDMGTLKVYFGDESTRLRLNQLISRTELIRMNVIKEKYEYLTSRSYPTTELIISLYDPDECFMEIFHDGIKSLDLSIKARRKDLLLTLENFNNQNYQILPNQELIVKQA